MTSVLTRTRTKAMTTAQALLRYLAAQQSEQFDGSTAPLFGGVAGIFGHGNVAGIGEALWQERDTLPYLRGHNEQGLAHTAIGFAKAHRARRVMAVTTSIGPGATNLVTAAALAHTNRLPLLLLPGDTYASRRPDPVLQQLEDPSCPFTSVNDCLRPVSRLFDRITRPEQLIDVLPRVIQVLLDPQQRGPVTLCLPQDVQAEAYDFPLDLFESRIHRIRRSPPDATELQEAARLLSEADFPLIIAGGGVHYSGAEGQLRSFADAFGIPVAETQAGKGSLPWDHPLNVGAVGVTGTAIANHAALRADCVLCVGTRLSDFTTASKSLFHKKGVELIGLNTLPFDAHKGRAQPLIADAALGLAALTELVQPRERSFYHSELNRLHKEWELIREKVINREHRLPSDAQVLATVNSAIPEDAIVVCAAGGLPGELHKFWRTRDPVGYHVEYAYSCMGYEIAGAVGAKLAHPDREVYVLVGDGSYLMLHSELLTAVQRGLKIHVVVLDNHGFGCINRLQRSCGSTAYGNVFEMGQVDFAANAASYGCSALKVDGLEGLSEAIKTHETADRCTVTVIETDPATTSPGYAWWDVPVAATSKQEGVRKAHTQYQRRVRSMAGEPQ